MKHPWVYRSTANARYLYYTDMRLKPTSKSENALITRVWDRRASKEVCVMENLVPVSPGPGQTTMILTKSRKGQHHLNGGTILHDAASGRVYMLAE